MNEMDDEELELPPEEPVSEKPKGKWNGPTGSGRQGSTKGRPVPPDMLKYFRAAFKKKKPGVEESDEVKEMRKFLAEDRKTFISQMTQLEKANLSTRANFLAEKPNSGGQGVSADEQATVTIAMIEELIQEATAS